MILYPGLHTLDVSSAHFPELWHPEMSADLAKFQSRIVMGANCSWLRTIVMVCFSLSTFWKLLNVFGESQ